MMAVSEGGSVNTLAARIIASIKHDSNGSAAPSSHDQAAALFAAQHGLDDQTLAAVLENNTPPADTPALTPA
jgi:hypothetical protein